MNLQADLMVLLPELILAVGAMVLLLVGRDARAGEQTAAARRAFLGRDPAVAGVRRGGVWCWCPSMPRPSTAPSSPTASPASPSS